MSSKHKRSGILFMILSAVFFSFKPIFAKLAYRHGVAPQVLLGMRMSIAIPLFWIFSRFTSKGERVSIDKKDIALFVVIGFVGFFLAAESSFFALKYIDASVNTMIVYTYPAIVTLLSFFILKEGVDAVKLVALVLVLAGTSAVLNLFSLNFAEVDVNPFGALLAFISAISFSFYYIFHRLLVKRIPSIKLTTYLITAGGIFVILYWHGGDIDQPYQVWLYALGLATVSTLLPFLLLGEGVKRLGASNAAIFSAIGPVSTISLSYIILGERLAPVQLIGAALIISGIIVLSKRRTA